MAYKYGHRSTAFNGVFKYVFNTYPKAKDVLGFYKEIPKDQQHCKYNIKGIEQFMKDYRVSRGSNPSNDYFKNALYIQKDFESFIKYCQEKLK